MKGREHADIDLETCAWKWNLQGSDGRYQEYWFDYAGLRLLFGQSIGGIDYSNDYLLLNYPNSNFVQHAYMPLLGFYTINESRDSNGAYKSAVAFLTMLF